MQVEIEFLIGIAPIFTEYLTVFQSEGPLIHCMYDEMKTMFLTILSRFMTPASMKDKLMGDLLKLNLECADYHLPLESIEIGVKAKEKVCSQRIFCQS